jgi:hypothetical protein
MYIVKYLSKINYPFTGKATIAIFLDRCLFPVPCSLFPFTTKKLILHNYLLINKITFFPSSPKSKTMNNPREYVILMAEILDLTIPDRYLNSVIENFDRLQEIASLVTEFELNDDGESALTFEP